MTIAIVLITALLVAFAETAWALTHHDSNGHAVGLNIVGAPIELVFGVSMLLMSHFVLTDIRQDVAGAIGLGALAAYASTWGKALGFGIVAVWAARRASDPDR